MLIDMNYIEDERANAIINEVKTKTEVEDWEDEAEKNQIIDQNSNSNEEFWEQVNIVSRKKWTL